MDDLISPGATPLPAPPPAAPAQPDYSELVRRFGGRIGSTNGSPAAAPVSQPAAPAMAAQPAAAAQPDYSELVRRFGGRIGREGEDTASQQQTATGGATSATTGTETTPPPGHPVWNIAKQLFESFGPGFGTEQTRGFTMSAMERMGQILKIANGLDAKYATGPISRTEVAQKVHQSVKEAADYLDKHSQKMGWTEGTPDNPVAGFEQHMGGLGYDAAEFYLLKGLAKLALPLEEFAVVGTAGENLPRANVVTNALTNAVERAKSVQAIGNTLKNYPVLNSAVNIGLKTMNNIAGLTPEFLENATVGGAQGWASSGGSVKGTAEGAGLQGVLGAGVDPLIGEASQYLGRTKDFLLGLKEKLVGSEPYEPSWRTPPGQVPDKIRDFHYQQVGNEMPWDGVQDYDQHWEEIRQEAEKRIAAQYESLGSYRRDIEAEKPIGGPPPIPEPELKREPTVYPKPLKPEFPTTDVGPEPVKPAPLEPLEHPAPPEPPTPLEPPAPLPPTEVGPEPQPSEPLEPTPPPPKPELLEDYSPDRAPIEQRIAEMERKLSQGVVGESSTAAAQQLEDMYDSLRNKNIARMKPENLAKLMQLRRSLAQYITRGSAPPESEAFISQAGDFATAAEMMRKPGAQARARWNDLSGGKFETLDNQLQKLEGKMDQESIAKRGDLQREMNRLVSDPKFMGSASPERRAIYKSMAQRADVVEEAGTVLDKSFKGAERTGAFDLPSLQRNWKAYVQKYGAEQVKDALGAERFTSMNDFVNRVAQEPAVDKAYQAFHTAQNQQMIKDWQKQASEVAAKDEAAQAAQDQAFEDATARWKEQQKAARAADVAAKKQQAEGFKTAKKEQSAAYKKAKADYDAGVKARNAERAQLVADRNAEYQRQVEEYEQAKSDAKDADEATKKKMEDEYNLKLSDWRLETERVKNLNVQHEDDYKALLAAKKASETVKRSRVGQILSKLKSGNPTIDMFTTGAGLAMPEMVLKMAQHGVSFRTAAAAGAGLSAYLLKKVLVNPVTGRLAAEALVSAGQAHLYGPAIYALVKQATSNEQEGSSTMVDTHPEGLREPGNIDITNRPVIQNADGSHSSELSYSMQDDDGKEVLFPTVVDGKFLTPDGKMPPMGKVIGGKYVETPEEKAMRLKAWDHYKKTGEHLGKFDTPEHADAYAQKLHEREEKK